MHCVLLIFNKIVGRESRLLNRNRPDQIEKAHNETIEIL